MKIGNVEIQGFTALAPMAGVADTAFRTLCKQCGASYLVGEMASAMGICQESEKSRELLAVTPEERPMAVQLFGSDPRVMAEAARRAVDCGPDIIDINMGCPAPKVTSNGAGSALMRDPALAGRVIAAVAQAVEIPVTVKIRKGWDGCSVNAVELARIAQESGAKAVTVHGRTREQQYAPPVDISVIAQVKRAVKIPVIGNGDVTDALSAKAMLEETGCDLVMIGRGALGNPWVFSQVETFLREGRMLPAQTLAQRMEAMLRHIRLLSALKGEHAAMLEARKHAAWYIRGIPGAAELRSRAVTLETLADAERLAERVLEGARLK